MTLLETNSVTVGEPVKIIIGNTKTTLVGDIPLDSLDEACKFYDQKAAKEQYIENFDEEKDKILNEALMSASAKKGPSANFLRGNATSDIDAAREARAVKFAKNDNCIHLFNKQEKSFPTGLLDRVKKILSQEGIEVIYQDNRSKPAKVHNWTMLDGEKKPRQYQLDGLEQTRKHYNLLFDWATNSGKTMLMAMIAVDKGVNTLILTHSGNLAYQLADAIEEFTGIKPGMCLGGKANLQPITVAVINSARTLARNLNEFGFDLVMVDEAHRAAAKSYVTVLSRLNPTYSYGFTGTPDRRGNDRLVIEATYGTERPKISNTEMIEAGFSCNVEVEFVEVDQTAECEKQDPYFLVYKNGIVDSTAFNTTVIETILSHLEEGRTIAVQVAQKQQGQLLYFALKEEGVKVCLVDGDSKPQENYKKLKDLHKGVYEVAIGTVINEGFDCDRLDVVVNAAGYMASSLTKQKLGRVLRTRPGKKNGWYIDFYSFGHPILEKHSRRRAETLEADGFKVEILDKIRAKEAAEKEKLMLEHAQANKKFEQAKKLHSKGGVEVQNKKLAKTKFVKLNEKEISLDG